MSYFWSVQTWKTEMSTIKLLTTHLLKILVSDWLIVNWTLYRVLLFEMQNWSISETRILCRCIIYRKHHLSSRIINEKYNLHLCYVYWSSYHQTRGVFLMNSRTTIIMTNISWLIPKNNSTCLKPLGNALKRFVKK